jgi:predicted O-linked N-acetylglucosamine transferase (SPINDLY family)
MTLNVPATPVPSLDRAFDLLEAGDRDGAIALCEAILRLDDKHYGALYLLGSILGETRKLDEAAAALQRAIAIDPSRPLAYFNLANVLRWMDRHEAALAAIDAYLAKKPDNFEAFVLRADSCIKAERLDEALRSAERAVALAPTDADAHNIRGAALTKLGRHVEACASFDRAVALNPRLAKAFRNRALAELKLKDHDRALASFEQALALNPDLDYVEGMLCQTRQQICAWSGLASQIARIRQAIVAGRRAAEPFFVLSILDSNSLSRKAAETFLADQVKTPPPPPRAPTRPIDKGRIHLGYFSSTLRGHAMAHLIAGVLERHDRTRFEMSAFSFAPGPIDAVTKQLTPAFDRFLHVRDQSDQQIAQLSQSLGVDIAIDLSGFTDDYRIAIFAHRAAPIQVNYLGYPGTTAAPFIDYLIADRVVIPEGEDRHFSERIVRLPNTYHPYDRTRQISEETPSRASLSLPETGFVFCCFNSGYKILPDVFDSWMRILSQTSGSVLWILRENDHIVQNLRREAQARGVDPGRLVFAERMPNAQHLARHRQADLFLDTLPCNAHTTASDALWAGLPVLTRIGEAFAGRVAASILTAVGLPETIVRSQAEYEATAIDLAANPDKLATIKAKLANNRLTAPLFDTEGFTRDLERAFEAMYERYRLGLPPERMDLAPSGQSIGLA